MKKIIVINGPNLNLLGKREPKTYGDKSFDSYFKELEVEFAFLELTSFQSNVEGEIINKIQETGFSLDGIVLNAGGYTHTSVAIADAIAAIKTPVIEVHISNVYAREEYRHQSLMAKNCKGVIAGFGLDSYKMAINSFLK
ncbi:MAG: type II 3-dehydroquinate dehydratase [Flavobacteriales bacterium]|nr:type II 3-dehydroquinate dehydratase [Flavobacteriales bacterium]MBL6868978.1 type II 3-dehydroquinate dehydratase [Flavobacteriales bacterium]